MLGPGGDDDQGKRVKRVLSLVILLVPAALQHCTFIVVLAVADQRGHLFLSRLSFFFLSFHSNLQVV